MIHLCGVSKRVFDEVNGARFVLRDVTLSFPGNACVALLGRDQSTLTTVLHLLAGSEIPDHGRVITSRLRRSPIINAGSIAGSTLAPRLSALDNINFFARLHSLDPDHLLAVVESVCRLDRLLRVPVREYGRPMRQALEVALIAALPYDCYFLDNVQQLFPGPLLWHLTHAVRARGAGLIFTAKQAMMAAKFGQLGAVVEDGMIRVYPHIRKAVVDYERRRH
jgi:capsular polysaccharide transport system ATP-binding protein